MVFLSIIFSILFLGGCALFSPPVTHIEPRNSCQSATGVVLNPVDADFVLAKYKEEVSGVSFHYKSDPKVVELISDSNKKLLIADDLICRAIHRQEVDVRVPAQIHHLRSWVFFMSTDPTTDQVSVWQTKNPFHLGNEK